MRVDNLKMSPKKCTLFQHEVPFLGHVVGWKAVFTDPLKVTAVEGWPVHTDQGEELLLCLCSYYKRFVSGFATITTPLHQLIRKGACFLWDEACQRAFEALKQALVNTPLLSYLDANFPYLLDTNTSADGVGAVL